MNNSTQLHVGALALYLVGLSALIFALYWPGLTGGFFFDDFANLLETPELQVSNFTSEAILNIWESGKAGPLGRPVSLLSFAINHYFSGFDPLHFKLTNIAIHALNAALAYILVFQLLRASTKAGENRKNQIIAGFIAVLWAVHPIQTTSVLYVVQRMTSLSATFMLIALILHILARQSEAWPTRIWSYLLAWAIFFPLALLSKETGILYFVYVAVYEMTLHPTYRRPADWFGRIYPAAVLAIAVIFLIYIFLISDEFLSGYAGRPFSMNERLMTEARILFKYVNQIVLPQLHEFGLYHDDVVVSRTLLTPPTTAASILALAGLGIYALIVRRRHSFIAFAILWFLGGHTLESTALPLELMHEHRNYIPSLGLMLLVAPVLTLGLSNNRSSWQKTTIVAIAGAFLCYASFVTYLRAQMYGNNYYRTQIEASFRPDSVRSNYEAGAAIVNLYAINPSIMLEVLARKHFERVAELDANDKLSLIGMLQLDCLSAQTSGEETLEELRTRLRDGRWIPADRAAVHGIAEMSKDGALCLTRPQVDELFAAALSNSTASIIDRSVVRSDYAMYLWLKEKDYIAARQVLNDSISENPQDILNRINLIQLHRLLGDSEAALALLANVAQRDLRRRDRNTVEAIGKELVIDSQK